MNFIFVRLGQIAEYCLILVVGSMMLWFGFCLLCYAISSLWHKLVGDEDEE